MVLAGTGEGAAKAQVQQLSAGVWATWVERTPRVVSSHTVFLHLRAELTFLGEI